MGSENAAISDFSEAIRLNPDFAAAYFNRAMAKDGLGQPNCDDLKKLVNSGSEDEGASPAMNNANDPL